MQCFSLVKLGNIHARKGKVIPKEEIETLLEAKEILEAAKQEALDRIEEAKEQCAEIHKKAHDEGFAEGLSSFNSHILHLDDKIKVMRHEMQKAMLPLTVKATKRIVGEAIEINPELIVEIVIQSIKTVSQSHRIKIYVNRHDLEILEKEKEKLKSIFERIETFSLEEKGDVDRGGCLIETENGILNASLENQYRALERAFEAFMKR